MVSKHRRGESKENASSKKRLNDAVRRATDRCKGQDDMGNSAEDEVNVEVANNYTNQ